MNKIDSIVYDIYEYVQGISPGEQDDSQRVEIVDDFVEACREMVYKFLEERGKRQAFRIRPSNLGLPARKLWFLSRTYTEASEASVDEEMGNKPYLPLTFLFGSLTEALILLLVKLTGKHEVTDFQKEVTFNGITGSLDARIDGRLVDVKSASSYSFAKFKANAMQSGNPEDDPFGYRDQLGAYASAEGDDVASWLVFDKSSGELTLNSIDHNTGLKTPNEMGQHIDNLNKVLANDTPPPDLCYPEVPMGKGGNLQISKQCGWCEFKTTCYPTLRAFKYATGPVYLSHVAKLPDVPEMELN